MIFCFYVIEPKPMYIKRIPGELMRLYLSEKILVQLYALAGYLFEGTSIFCGIDLRDFTRGGMQLKEFKENIMQVIGIEPLIIATADTRYAFLFQLNAEAFQTLLRKRTEEDVCAEYLFKVNVARNRRHEELYFNVMESTRGPSLIKLDLKLYAEHPLNTEITDEGRSLKNSD